jgi:hypothetical protein
MDGFSAFTHWVRFKIPFTPFDKLMTGFDRLRANGIWNHLSAVFRMKTVLCPSLAPETPVL